MAVKNFNSRIQYNPFLASIHWNFQDDTIDEWTELFKILQKLPRGIRQGLISEKVRTAVMNLSRKHSVNELEKIGEISRIIRDIFVKGTREQEIRMRVKEKIGIQESQLNEFILDLKAIIYLVKDIGSKTTNENIDELPIIPALKKYEKMGEQSVSAMPIKLEIFNDFVRPSVKNWLEDYIQRMGSESHNTLQRSDYLFNSENGKKLNSTERDKLAILLKSYDEKTNIMIDRESGEIIFEEVEEAATQMPQSKTRNNFGEKTAFQRENFQSRENSISNFPKKQTTVDLSKQRGETDYYPIGKPSSNKKENEDKGKNVLDLSEYI